MTAPGGDATTSRTVGVIGVGEIAAAIVRAVATGPHAASYRFVLSPRSADRSAALAEQFATATVAADNQAVLDDAEAVILAVLPEQVPEVCAGLRFRADHVVIGLAAGWPPSRLAPTVAPATAVCQLIPLPMIALHTGPIVLYPRISAVAELLDGCGTLVVPGSEDAIPAMSAASAVMSTYFEFERTVIAWLIRQGYSAAEATNYVTALLSGLAAESVTHSGSRDGLVTAHETPGGLNAQLRETLRSAGLFDTVMTGLDALLERLGG